MDVPTARFKASLYFSAVTAGNRSSLERRWWNGGREKGKTGGIQGGGVRWRKYLLEKSTPEFAIVISPTRVRERGSQPSTVPCRSHDYHMTNLSSHDTSLLTSSVPTVKSWCSELNSQTLHALEKERGEKNVLEDNFSYLAPVTNGAMNLPSSRLSLYTSGLSGYKVQSVIA